MNQHNIPKTRDNAIIHSLTFQVQGANETQVDKMIEHRLEDYIADPSEWIVVQKNMVIQMIPSASGDGQIAVCEASVTCIRLAGWIPWYVDEKMKHGHEEEHS